MAEKRLELPSETRQRLLQVAGEVFADRGFQHATIRDICRRAGVNIAAVNYHFGDKNGLYLAVLQDAQETAMKRYPVTEISPELPPEQRLLAFIRAMIGRIFDRGRPSWQGKLMAREMMEPTEALQVLVETAMRPQSEILESIVRDIIGRRCGEQELAWAMASVVGQVVYYYHCRAVLNHLNPVHKHLEQNLDGLAAHIARFSMAGLQGITPGGK